MLEGAQLDRFSQLIPAEVSARNLLAEQEHRTQNILQMIASLLSRAAAGTHGDAANTLFHAQAQIQAFALLNQALNHRNSQEAGQACCTSFLADVCSFLVRGCLQSRGIALYFSASAKFNLDERRCRHLGLAVTEAVLNAAKHAFDDDGGAILVELSEENHSIQVVVQDNGHGMREAVRSNSQGLGLIDWLLTSVGGTVTRPPLLKGTRVCMQVPVRGSSGSSF